MTERMRPAEGTPDDDANTGRSRCRCSAALASLSGVVVLIVSVSAKSALPIVITPGLTAAQFLFIVAICIASAMATIVRVVHATQQIGLWKCPGTIDVVPDLPQTASGKVQRFRLRAER